MKKGRKARVWSVILTAVLASLAMAALTACEDRTPAPPETTAATQSTAPETLPSAPEPATAPTETTVPQETTTSQETTPPQETTAPARKYLIVIDPGHQCRGNPDPEPIGPGASQTKAKVTGGTEGRFTGLAEYELNLQVSLLLRELLLERGYEVVMVRTEHDVDLSNAQRAAIANELQADVFIRIHANGSENPDTRGMMTICQTPENPYNGELYQRCRLLSELVLEEMVASTGGKRQYVWETDTMSGINWCAVPVTIVEMGYMTNETEDRLMATPEYQLLLAEGIAKGIERYLLAAPEADSAS